VKKICSIHAAALFGYPIRVGSQNALAVSLNNFAKIVRGRFIVQAGNRAVGGHQWRSDEQNQTGQNRFPHNALMRVFSILRKPIFAAHAKVRVLKEHRTVESA
jgi:hypothetical protein